ncbi:hypothetical protein RB195_019318 [Necator americanus]|uniref:Uncharacterized protein n=1 Tax=Necator americanus TaxID=51031 RepID=A0ABR1CFM3_NECAM
MPIADDIVRQLCVEFKKVSESSAKVSNAFAERADIHEREQHAKFQKYLESRSRSATSDIIRLELEKEQRCYTDAEKEMVSAEQRILKTEKSEQARVDELKNNILAMRKTEMDITKEQSMRDMYQDMIDKLAEMHILSRHSQKSSLAKERSLLNEQVLAASNDVDQLRNEVNSLTAALEETGYAGLLHDTRRSAMLLMKNKYTAMKDELIHLRLATHTLRIRARTAQANLAIEK